MNIYDIPLAINMASKDICSLFDKFTIFLFVSIYSTLVLVKTSISPDYKKLQVSLMNADKLILTIRNMFNNNYYLVYNYILYSIHKLYIFLVNT